MVAFAIALVAVCAVVVVLAYLVHRERAKAADREHEIRQLREERDWAVLQHELDEERRREQETER